MTDNESNDCSNKLQIANLGKTLSEEHKRKIGESQKGIKRENRKKCTEHKKEMH